jgi:hypothetical protein
VKLALRFLQHIALAAVALVSPAQAATEIAWWHAMSGDFGKQLEKFATDFNASPSDYRIVPSYKGNYTETGTASIFAFRSRSQPAIVPVNEIATTRLPGVLSSEAWPALPEDQKERVLGQIGAIIAEAQHVPVDELCLVEPGWDQFIAAQNAACRARHIRLGLPHKFLDGLDDLLREVPALIPLDTPSVMLTGEYIPENFLLGCDGARWRLSGLFDFGDVMTGWG